jgi:hypothetical protein
METKVGATEATMDAIDECSGFAPVVRVTFTPPDTISVTCPVVKMPAAGVILMLQKSDSAEWTFVGTNGLPEPEFETKVVGTGRVMIVNDAHTTTGTFEYTITVNDATGNHTSQFPSIKQTTPPMIMNR